MMIRSVNETGMIMARIISSIFESEGLLLVSKEPATLGTVEGMGKVVGIWMGGVVGMGIVLGIGIVVGMGKVVGLRRLEPMVTGAARGVNFSFSSKIKGVNQEKRDTYSLTLVLSMD